MEEDDIRVPIYLITGFLEAGKTSFLNFTCRQDYFQIDEPTLLINCEEGEEEYDSRNLLKYATLVAQIEDEDEFTPEKLVELDRKYKPERVIIEYNPLWGVPKLEEMKMPEGWGIVQEIVIVDCSTFQLYMTNMKSLFMEMARNADLVLFNRADKKLPLANFRRSIKVANPATDVQFIDKEGDPVDIFEDSVPYDLSQDIIDIEDVDYGIFFVDMQDHPERYKGRKVRFKGQVLKSRKADAPYFIPARSAMTCCAQDMQYIGYICHSKNAKQLVEGSWVEVTATVDSEYIPSAGGEEPVYHAISIKSAQAPADENVYFN